MLGLRGMPAPLRVLPLMGHESAARYVGLWLRLLKNSGEADCRATKELITALRGIMVARGCRSANQSFAANPSKEFFNSLGYLRTYERCWHHDRFRPRSGQPSQYSAVYT